METYLTQAAPGQLLLVMVDSTPASPGAWPCHVVGAVSPWDAPPSASPAQDRVLSLLTAVGVPANLLGHAYLRTALTLILSDSTLRRSMTRALYPRVASLHQATPQSVERAIRHAISAAWARSGGAGYHQALGRLASYVGERPTNSEFIAQAAERLMQG